MKIAFIDIGWHPVNPFGPLQSAIGGSETWLFQLSEKMAEKHQVDVFFTFKKPECGHVHVNDNLTYYDKSETQRILLQSKYDFVILNRFVEQDGFNFVEFIKENQIANHIYMQMHDLSLFDKTLLNFIPIGGDVSKMHYDDDFLTIVTLNEWHKENLLKQYNIPANHIICAPNGLDLSLFDNKKTPIKDHRVLWSSCAERGLDILVKEIYPRVKKYVPDFGIDVVGYNDIDMSFDSDVDIRYLGKLSKEQLYEEQRKHRVWFYPGTFAETFCITMIENVMNDVKIVSPITYGMNKTLGPFADELRCGEAFDKDEVTTASSIVQCCVEIVNTLLHDKNEQEQTYNSLKKFIRENYNWYHTADLYIEDYDKKYRGVEPAETEVCFMTMFCNQQFFKDGIEVVKQTWAKPILEGNYPNAMWYGFTACDEQHPEECIDEQNHIVYVQCEDTLTTTYTKMKKAYTLLQCVHPFKKLVRTNTSVYLNLHKIFDLLDNITDNQVCSDWCGYYTKDYVFLYNMFCGNCYLASAEFCNKIFYSDYSEYSLGIADGDDVIANKIMYLLDIPHQQIDMSYNTPSHFCYLYKRCTPYDKNRLSAEELSRYTENPQIIHEWPFVSVRSMYVDLQERMLKGDEPAHMYELDFAYNNPVGVSDHVAPQSVVENHFDLLFIAMSCNLDFFKLEEQVIRDTWAKPIIEGAYENIGFFTYKSCNNEHPTECIDGNTIYVDVPDDLDHTYSKTKRAFQLLKENGYTWDYVVRTNTSCFWNVKKTIELYHNKLKNNEILASVYGGYYVPLDDFDNPSPIGWAMILPKSLTDYMIESDFDETLGSFRDIIGDRIYDKNWFPYRFVDDALIGLLCYLIKDTHKYERYELGCYHYRCFYKTGPLANVDTVTLQQFEDSGVTIDDCPEMINDIVVAQTRSWGIKETRYFELEHLYELNKALHK